MFLKWALHTLEVNENYYYHTVVFVFKFSTVVPIYHLFVRNRFDTTITFSSP